VRLYSGPLSLFSAKARIALAEKGLAHELVQVGWSRAAAYAPHHPDVVALNPKRQVPVLVDGAVVVYDSTQIAEYLEDAYPAPPLFPASAALRARCRQQEAAADEIWFPQLWRLIEAGVYGSGSAEAARAAAEELARLLLEFERGLGDRAYWCGAFSVADIGSFVFASTAITLGAPLPDGVDRTRAWLERVAARPAVRAVMDDLRAAAARLLAGPSTDAAAARA
jgi:glutathione S-transferase